jgi:hypothetical protein
MIALGPVTRQLWHQSSRPVSFLLNRVRLRPVLFPGTGRLFAALGIPRFAETATKTAADPRPRRGNDPPPLSRAAMPSRAARCGPDDVQKTPTAGRLSPGAAIFCIVLFSSIGWVLILTSVFWLD